MTDKEILDAYEEKFGDQLLSAWDFESVDWKGLLEAAEQSLKTGIPLTDEQKKKYYGQLENGNVY